MNNSQIPLKNTTINSLGTFISRLSGIIKFNVVNYLFGANADTFYSANNNILCLRKVFGEGPLVNTFLPIFSKEKNHDTIKADQFASNIFTQITIVSLIVTIISIILTPLYTRIFLPGFVDQPKEFNEIVSLTMIMLLSTTFFSAFSIAMGLLNAHEKFVSSSISPAFSNIIFVIFPLLSYQQLGIMSLAWGMVFGSLAQFIIEGVELYRLGYRYQFVLDFKNPLSQEFWRRFFPISLNYLTQCAISVGLGFFASFLPKGSMTYLRNANTIINAPVGFIGVAISGTIFPIFAKVKHDNQELAKSFMHGMIFFLFTVIPISVFFCMYSDIIIYTIFRDISRLFSGSTGKYTQELLLSTISATQVLSTIIIPWSALLIIGKLFYSMEKPRIPLYLIIINFVLNIVGYKLSQIFEWGGGGLVYADLVAGWSTFIISIYIIYRYLPQIKQYFIPILNYTLSFITLSYIIWFSLSPLHQVYQNITSPLFLLIISGVIFVLGLCIFGLGTHLIHKNPITNKQF